MERGSSVRPLSPFVLIAGLSASLVLGGVPSYARASETQDVSGSYARKFSDAHAAFGKKSSVDYVMGAIQPSPQAPASDSSAFFADAESTEGDSKAGFFALLSSMLLGRERSILETQASVTDLLEGESDFYWGGFRVWSTKPEWKDGAFQISAGLPSVSMRAPLAGIPVGPVTLRLDAGVVAEAKVEARLRPLISIPIEFTAVQAELAPVVSATGFVEGYGKWIAVRAGVGGSLEIIRSNAKITGEVSFGSLKPRFTFDGFVSLLAGKIYAFVDYFNVLSWKWKRAFKPTIADWKGKCIDLSPTETQGGDPCVAP